ncbi:site-specific integrase [Bacteroides sp. KH569_7]|uniref:Site-specific integrase n=1 Tax=Bacteroides muris (ex Fokt et al. 2023) TaxID=2937417 RepID=A0A9X2NXU5_9BACE|nr:site-specific integrase [Bacteroides muris (ex Fokt et al. 2023)]MCR6507919.1 site-specific integrase [Bacteroides muris (ex Fokt et al. 2023)]
MKSTFRVLFFLKRDKVKKNGNMPIMARITIDGKLAQFNTKLEVNPKNWSAKTGKVNGRGAEFTRMNEMLDSIKATLHRHYQTILERDSYVTAEKVRNVFLGKEEKAKTLLQVFSQHNEQYALKVGKTATQKTYTRYELTKNRLAEYIHNKYNVEDITFREINVVFIEGFYLFIRENYPCTHNTAMKFIQRFRTVVLFAHNLGLITFNPFGAYKLKFEYVERDFLEQAELDRIYQKTFASKRLEQVRDIFIFSFFTGLAFSDVKDLSPEHLVKDNKGELRIRKNRQKTKIMCNIPVLPVAASILDKYKDVAECTGKLLPVLCNQRMNSYLKEIADVCGIHKNLSTHTARHSYATSICLANGVSMENVAKMLGHADTSVTKHYARVLDQNIFKDMQKVNSCLSELAI